MTAVAANNWPADKEAGTESRLGPGAGRTSKEKRTRAEEAAPIDWRRARVRERDGNMEDSRNDTRLAGNCRQAGSKVCLCRMSRLKLSRSVRRTWRQNQWIGSDLSLFSICTDKLLIFNILSWFQWA